MFYIEKEENGKFFNPTSNTVIINPSDMNGDGNSLVNVDNDPTINKNRWKWIMAFDAMSFKEKLSLFLPMHRYLNLKDITKDEFEKSINDFIVDSSFETCRPFSKISIQSNSQDIPIFVFTFDKVDFRSIPYEFTSYLVKIKNWADKYAFGNDIVIPDIVPEAPEDEDNPYPDNEDQEPTCPGGDFIV